MTVKSHKGCGPIGKLSPKPVELLLCFAVKEEARFFMDGMAYRSEHAAPDLRRDQ